MVAGLAALVAAWFRQRNAEREELALQGTGTASWPPLDPTPAAASDGTDDAPPSAATPTTAQEPAATSSTAAETPIAEPSDGAAAEAPRGEWIDPDPDGGCPLSHPVKAKLRSGIYHVPEGLAYERTNADRCYASPEAAENDGYRASKM